MPTNASPAVTPQSEAEAFIVQHALAFYREMKRNAKNAPFGEFLHYAEAAAITQGRDFVKTSLQTLAQEEVNEVEKKNETRLCRTCRKKKRHLGGKTKNIETAVGRIKLKRRYDECRPCDLQEFIVDAILGIGEGYTVGLRSLAVYAGAGNSFEMASEHLKKYCGLELSHMTIRELCRREAPKIDAWYQKSLEVQRNFIAALGNVEITMDGTCVNTTEGAREVKVGIIFQFWEQNPRLQAIPLFRSLQSLTEVFSFDYESALFCGVI